MRVFVLPDSYGGEEFVSLEGDDFHYLCRVRRLREGDSFAASDKEGNQYHLTLEEVGRKVCRLRVQRKGKRTHDLPRMTLFQCLPKGRKLDTIVRQATELGVTRIVPVESRFSVPKLEGGENRADRWIRVAKEAAQQSGAVRVPEVLAPIRFRDIPRVWGSVGETRLGIFFHQTPLETTSLHEYLSIRREEIGMVVGPEGGLSDEEVFLLKKEGFVPAYLGPTVLRTETAPVFAVAALQIILLENKTWKLV